MTKVAGNTYFAFICLLYTSSIHVKDPGSEMLYKKALRMNLTLKRLHITHYHTSNQGLTNRKLASSHKTQSRAQSVPVSSVTNYLTGG